MSRANKLIKQIEAITPLDPNELIDPNRSDFQIEHSDATTIVKQVKKDLLELNSELKILDKLVKKGDKIFSKDQKRSVLSIEGQALSKQTKKVQKLLKEIS